LKEAFVEIGEQFERQHPGEKLIFNFSSSGSLAQQIERGAPADIFASAAVEEMTRLKEKHLVDESSIQPFAGNRLVVIVPTGARPISSLGQLAQLGKIAIGNPESSPAGKYAAEALAKADLYKSLLSEHKLVFAENVRQALTYVESANVDAGIVYASDSRMSKQVVVSFQIPERFTEPIVYPVALVRDSKHVELGRSFIRFLVSSSARSILQSNGFLPVDK